MMIISLNHIWIAIIAGIFTGVFFGPYCHILDPISQIYFMLLQMTILPYIPCLLIHGIGSLSFYNAKKLLERSWFVLLLLWGSSLLFINLFALVIPTPTTFLSDGTESFLISSNVLSYLIPKNLFYDLANNIIPAIAIFGLITGISLIWVKQKQTLLTSLGSINAGIERILYWLAKCAPIVIFTHLAVVTGTLRMEDLKKIEFYMILIIIASLFFTFVLFPILLTCLTKMKYKEIMQEIKEVCLIPFIVCYPTIAFPFLIKTIRRFFERHKLFTEETSLSTQAVLPLSFTFGQVGNIFIILIISFLAFYTRHNIDKIDSILLPIISLPMSFGTIYTSIASLQFLLDILHFPSIAFDFFQQTTSLTLNFQVLVSTAAILTMTLLVLSSLYGMLQVRLKRLIFLLFLSLAGVSLCVWFVRPHVNFPDNFTDLYPNLRMERSVSTPISLKIYTNRSDVPPNPYSQLTVLERVLQRGVLRVGYHTIDIPFCYWNNHKELVGYDIAFAYRLAEDLNCSLELIPLEEGYDTLAADLNSGFYDVFMSALVMTERRLEEIAFVKPYFELNNVLVIPSEKKIIFDSLQKAKEMRDLKIGGIGAYYDYVKRNFPLADAVKINNLDPLIDKQIDAVMWSSLSSFLWSLSYPGFSVVQYGESLGKCYISYGVKKDELEWMNFLDDWLILKSQSGFSKEQRDYWLLGVSSKPRPPRASILGYLIKKFQQWQKTLSPEVE